MTTKTQPTDKAQYAAFVWVTRDGFVFDHGKQVAQFKNNHGYPCVRIRIGHKRRTIPVHRMVADCFLPPRPTPSHEVRHLDGIKTHNIDTNLKWGTRKENAADREAHGHTAKGSKNGTSKLTEAAVFVIRQMIKVGISQRKIAKYFNITQQRICQINRKEGWNHV